MKKWFASLFVVLGLFGIFGGEGDMTNAPGSVVYPLDNHGGGW